MPIDYKKYPPNWKSEIVPFVLNRAENKCERCGLHNGQRVFSVKMWIRTESGRYQTKQIWFQSSSDALRESGMDPRLGFKENYRVKECKVVLTVSHLDHDELNHDIQMDRLEALCQSCHLRYDAKEKYRRSLLPKI